MSRNSKSSIHPVLGGRGNIRTATVHFPTMDATQIALSDAKAGVPKIADKEKEADVGVILSVSGPGTWKTVRDMILVSYLYFVSSLALNAAFTPILLTIST